MERRAATRNPGFHGESAPHFASAFGGTLHAGYKLQVVDGRDDPSQCVAPPSTGMVTR